MAEVAQSVRKATLWAGGEVRQQAGDDLCVCGRVFRSMRLCEGEFLAGMLFSGLRGVPCGWVGQATPRSVSLFRPLDSLRRSIGSHGAHTMTWAPIQKRRHTPVLHGRFAVQFLPFRRSACLSKKKIYIYIIFSMTLF